jgi:hypothetical protein
LLYKLQNWTKNKNGEKGESGGIYSYSLCSISTQGGGKIFTIGRCGGNGVRGVYQVVVNRREEGIGWGEIYPSAVMGYIVEGGGRRVEEGF